MGNTVGVCGGRSCGVYEEDPGTDTGKKTELNLNLNKPLFGRKEVMHMKL